jgi:hypothetical protein
MCPIAAQPYLSRRRAPGGSPNPSRLGGNHSPVRPPTRRRRRRSEGGEGEIGAVRGSAVHHEDRSRPWEELDPPSPRMTTSPASSTSPTTRRRLPLLPPRRRAAPPHYTNACTSARGHRGEDDRFPPLVVAPAIEPRWNTPMLRAAAPSLVMPAFVPGWDEVSCRCRRLRQCAPLSWPSLPVSSLSTVRCHSRSRRRAEPIAFALAFACVASQT